jgi:hypothetical protein
MKWIGTPNEKDQVLTVAQVRSRVFFISGMRDVGHGPRALQGMRSLQK